LKRTLVLGLATGLVVVALTSVALAAPSANNRFKASLDPRQEVPAPKGVKVRTGGSFTATLSGSSLAWKLSFKQLTGSATAAHIHLGAKGKAGPVSVPLCGPCASGVSGTAKLTSAQISSLKNGGMYVNVHTAENPAGEIRGQIRR
jgi:hypothetical protein